MVHQSGDRSRPLRVAYVSGPAEGPRIYTDLVENRAPSYFGTNYMQGFLQMMIEMGAEVWIETWHDGAAYRIRKDSFTFNNSPLAERSGVRYHLSMIWAQSAFLYAWPGFALLWSF